MNSTKIQSEGYLVMARKWRPSTFSEVVGQQHIVRSLQNAIKLNRIAGAYLFSGMRGVGKTSMARIFAKSINCQKGPTLTPCGICENCIEIAEGRSLDVIEIDGASNNGVAEVREIRDHLQYAPAKCRTKIYIIDEVHMLSASAFNAFLKTLEEPPPRTTFILATTEQNKIPETILSRCQCFEFRALSDAQIAEKLGQIGKQEMINVTDNALLTIARRAEGSMRDAQSLLDQAAAYSEEINEETVGIVLGLVSRDKIWKLLVSVFQKDTDMSLKQLHELYHAGFEIGVITRELFEAVRELTIVQVSREPETILGETGDALRILKEVATGVSSLKLQQYYEILLRAEYQSKNASNPLSVLEMTLIKMINLDDLVPVGEIISKLQQIHKGSSFGSQPTRKAEPYPSQRPRQFSTSAQNAKASEAPSSAHWDTIKNAICQKSPRMTGILQDISNFEINDTSAMLSIPEKSSFIEAQLEGNRGVIESVIESIMGKKLTMVIYSASTQPKVPYSEKKNGIDSEGRRKMLNDQLIIKAVKMFEGQPGFDDE